MGVLELEGHMVRASSSQSACLKPRKHHPNRHGVGVHWSGGCTLCARVMYVQNIACTKYRNYRRNANLSLNTYFLKDKLKG